jgi:hypothetical protein
VYKLLDRGRPGGAGAVLPENEQARAVLLGLVPLSEFHTIQLSARTGLSLQNNRCRWWLHFLPEKGESPRSTLGLCPL